MGDALLNPEGDVLYYQAAFEGGYDLWKHDLKEDKTQIVMKEVGDGALEADNDFKNLYICAHNGIKKIDLSKQSSSNVGLKLGSIISLIKNVNIFSITYGNK